MKIRSMRKVDIPACAQMIGQNFSAAYQRSGTKELHYMFGQGPIKPRYLVVEKKGIVLGFGGYIQSWMDYDVYELFWINVKKEFQNIGIGKTIVEKMLAEIKRKKPHLIILSTDKPNYYTRWGFKKLSFPHNQGYTKMALSFKK